MEDEASVTLIRQAEAATEALEEVSRHAGGTHRRTSGEDQVVARIEATTRELRAMVDEMASRRVIMLAGAQVMEAGVVLYNASRSAYKTMSSEPKKTESELVFSVLVLRYLATRIMGLALACSGENDQSLHSSADQLTFFDECLDVLRSYGRVGSLLLEKATTDNERCTDYLQFASDALDHAMKVWSQIGLTTLTKLKQDLDLEEVIQDLWDFCLDRIRVIRFHRKKRMGDEDGNELSGINETLHELQMLLPYISSGIIELLELITVLSDDWKSNGYHEDQGSLVEEALRLCDTIEHSNDLTDGSSLKRFKRHILLNLLESLIVTGDVPKAEACLSVLGRDSSSLLCMIKLYVRHGRMDKAAQSLKMIFQQNDLKSSLTATRMYVEAQAYSESALQVFVDLERSYGDNILEIRTELACCRAMSTSIDMQKQARENFKHIGADASHSDRTVQKRITRAIIDATHNNYNAGSFENSIEWATLGLSFARTPSESAHYSRMISAAYLKMDLSSESWRFAQEAFKSDSSKKSLFSAFQAALASEILPPDTGVQLVQQVCQREDFEIRDLFTFGYAANEAHRHELSILIMDELCNLTLSAKWQETDIPIGILLQNAAQLAYRSAMQSSSGCGDLAPAETYTEKFLGYVDILLQACAELDRSKLKTFGPPQAFRWFFGMSITIAKSRNSLEIFVKSADIARCSDLLFNEQSLLHSREQDSLLTAISLAMAKLEAMSTDDLRFVLGIIERCVTLVDTTTDGDSTNYLEKCRLTIKVRLLDPDIDSLMKICQAAMGNNCEGFIEMGELVLNAARFDEATGVCAKYRELACAMFRYSLQLSLQQETTQVDQLSYLFRRLITLSESRQSAFEWFEQLLQLSNSIEICLPEIDVEWLVNKAWNFGIQEHRQERWKEAQRFMQLALALLGKFGTSLEQLSTNLHKQYDHVIAWQGKGRAISVDSGQNPVL
ncbi:hypothetical protein Poli38472_006121 [Pythium oligandrum]|uniref:Protein ZIP4 homolog n=1 Tax=Pythium oligandrum TaxID=41045 RepID=A0A8K1FSL0_PYTOL|nr:hypothetical protein Poli38472_006121 [Pythium oligandrum]|eukprot:TMW68653.1 hypothetical protein Poli38472_006121 [Pythium oligandrum]